MVEMHPRQALAVKVAVAVGGPHPDLASCRLLEPDRCARRADGAGRQLDDPVDDRIHAFGTRELAAEFEQRGRTLGLPSGGFVETGVLERDSGVAGEHFEQAHVVLVELVEAELGDHDHADDARPVGQGHDDL